MFSSKSLIVSGLIFMSLIDFEFIFVYGVRECSNFILLHVAVQFSQHHLLKKLSFLHCLFLPPLSKIRWPGFPGGAVVENLPANAGNTGSSPGSGKIPHAAEQLGPWATTTEPARLEPVPCNGRGHDGERPAHRDEEWPPLATTGEGPRTETKTQHSHK